MHLNVFRREGLKSCSSMLGGRGISRRNFVVFYCQNILSSAVSGSCLAALPVSFSFSNLIVLKLVEHYAFVLPVLAFVLLDTTPYFSSFSLITEKIPVKIIFLKFPV